MTLVCKYIDAGTTPSCDSKLYGGVEDALYLINREDIATITRNVTNPQIIEAITLLSGKVAYKFTGKNNSSNTRFEMVKKTYDRFYKHFVDFLVFDISPTGFKLIEQLAEADLVAIVINKYKGTDGSPAIKIYGLDQGLRADTITQNMTDDNEGAIPVTLSSDDKELEPHAPSALFKTDYATSLALITSLLA